MSDDLTYKELNTTFHSISNALDTVFIEEASIEDIDEQIKKDFSSVIGDKDLKKESNELMTNIKNEVDIIDVKREELSNAITTARIKDADFLETEIKSLILSSKSVLQTLERDIKVGAPPRMYEVYATLLNAITGQYKELRQLNEAIAKFVIENKKQNLDETKEVHKVMMSSTDALDMYMAAKNGSQMDVIETDFSLVDEEYNKDS